MLGEVAGGLWEGNGLLMLSSFPLMGLRQDSDKNNIVFLKDWLLHVEWTMVDVGQAWKQGK